MTRRRAHDSGGADGGLLSIAMIGTRGVPARYGGFETCVEEVGRRLAARGHTVRVYCRSSPDGQPTPLTWEGMELVRLPALRSRIAETLSHTGFSVLHLLTHRTDAAVVFNAANAPLLPLVRAARVPVATHVDGLEWRRAKWGRRGQQYYRTAEELAVRWSDLLIADAAGIAQYYRDEFDVDTELIVYGAPVVDGSTARLAELGLTPRGFHLVVARFEPENHVLEIVQGYRASAATLPLVVVGSAPYAHGYTAAITEAAAGDQRIQLLGGVWDQELLDQLYAGAATYLHGHSVGGTNPSLLRAIGAGAATIAFDVSFNREVLGAAGVFFDDSAGVARRLEELEADPPAAAALRAAAVARAKDYDWDEVADDYEELCRRLAARDRLRPGRRRRRMTRETTRTAS